MVTDDVTFILLGLVGGLVVVDGLFEVIVVVKPSVVLLATRAPLGFLMVML